MSDFERRSFATELRSESNSERGPQIFGHGAVFNTRSVNLGGFREIIMPGAFDDAINDDVRAVFNHDQNFILGRSSSGTLRLSLDDTGLAYEIDAPDTQSIRDLVLTPMVRGDLRESSFMFSVAYDGDEWMQDDEGIIVRKVHRVSRLYDVGPVTYPAYESADSAKRFVEQMKSDGDLEKAINQRSYRERLLNLIR